MIDKKQLHEIISDLLEVIGEKNLQAERIGDGKVTFDTLFKEACSYQRGILASQSKSQSSHGESVGKEVGRFSPSPKQYKILTEMGLKKEKIMQLSKIEVSKIIGTYLNNLKKENI